MSFFDEPQRRKGREERKVKSKGSQLMGEPLDRVRRRNCDRTS
ncbi:hypothetical protein QUA32_11175 [Microcoleus sp. Pol14D6]